MKGYIFICNIIGKTRSSMVWTICSGEVGREKCGEAGPTKLYES